MRASQRFEILPGYQVEKTVQYPDMASLKGHGPMQLQPMQLGAHYFCAAAKFGVNDIFKTGFEKDQAKTTLQLSINQLNPAEKIAKIDFKWKKYENADNTLFFYRFQFITKEGTQLGQIQNMSDKLLQQAISRAGYQLVDKKQASSELAENEIIVAIKLALRKSSSIVSF